MQYIDIVYFAYISVYLTKQSDIKFNLYDYFNNFFIVDKNSNKLFLDFINFLHKKNYADTGWCVAFKHYWDTSRNNKYIQTFKRFSNLDDEGLSLILTHFCSEIYNKRYPENEISMENLLKSWLKKYKYSVSIEYDFLFEKAGKDDVLFENLPIINLKLPDINNKDKIEELIYALEDIETDNICKSIIEELKDELSIGLGIDFKN